MSDSSVQITSAVQKQTPAKARKPYHTPRLENYGTVSELTRSGVPAAYLDAGTGYSSIPA